MPDSDNSTRQQKYLVVLDAGVSPLWLSALVEKKEGRCIEYVHVQSEAELLQVVTKIGMSFYTTEWPWLHTVPGWLTCS